MTQDKKPRSAGMIQPRISDRPRPLLGPDTQNPAVFQARVLTLFPEIFPGALGHGLTGKALSQGLWHLETLDIRAFARDRHRSVDDTPAGGGPGMVMRADVVAAAIDAARGDLGSDAAHWPLVYLSPRGRRLDQATARRLAAGPGVVLLCGRYEGVDERVLETRGVEEISLGDYVLTGGELPAMVLLDAVIRLRAGVLGNDQSVEDESFSRGLLEHPHYTKPPLWEGRAIPEVLLSGHHARIANWRHEQSERLTQKRRPDLWRDYQARNEATEQSDAQTSAVDGGQKKD